MSTLVAALLLGVSFQQDDPASRAKELVAELDSERIENRERAEKGLEALGKDALPELRRVQATATGEYAIRLQRALRRVLLGDPFEEKLLDTIKGEVPRWIFFSVAGHVAYEGGAPGASCAVLDGVAGEEFRSIERIAFSPDGRTLSYVGKTDLNAQAIIGGRSFGPYSSLGCGRVGSPNPIVISPDGKRFAFHAHTDQGHFVIVDGKPEGPYDDADQPVFSPDSTHLGYAANRGGEYKESAYNVSGGKWFLVIDGKKGEEYD